MDTGAATLQGSRSLGGAWSLCAGPVGEHGPPDERANWRDIPGPMTVASALRATGEWSLDDDASRNFDQQDWWFRARFDASEGAAVLAFDGIATIASASLNGRPVLSSDNMFIAHECDVASLLQPHGNELLIHCACLDDQFSKRRPRPRWRTPMILKQQLRWARTTLLGRTPGWSPPAAPVGPWRDVRLLARGEVCVRHCVLRARLEDGVGVLHCRVGNATPAMSAELHLSRGGRRWSQPLAWNEASHGFEGELRVSSADRWWPHTHGEPALYEASVSVRHKSGRTQELRLPPVGFRTLQLNTANGGFELCVNDVPVFCRGAVWTPIDPVALRSPPQAHEEALAQVRSAGMNMLRLAGTTVYEEDAFYAACSRAGVLVWQDFMFANMDYPVSDEAFVRSAAQEVRQQVERLASHACLAVLCGNSEVEQQAAMWGAPRELWTQPLFHETIPRICEELAPSIPYWPSSAHGGALPHQPDSGTTSYYGVGAYLRPLSDARHSGLKFATECLAFANIPAESTLARMPGGLALRPHHPHWKARTPRDLNAGWDFEDVRDHYVEQLFGADARELRSVDPARYLDLGRLATAEVMSASFSEWRNPASACSGALVLMLRDYWAGAGWGLLDDQGVPKACWHALKRTLQPVTVLLTDEGLNGLQVHVINEAAAPRELELSLTAWRDGETCVAQAKRLLKLPARGCESLPAAALLDHFMDLNHSYRFGPAPCDLVLCTLRDGNGAAVARAHHFPTRAHLHVEQDVGLQAKARRRSDDIVELRVTSRRVAAGVHFEMAGMVADDEYFHLVPGEEATVVLRARGGTPPQRGSVCAINSRQAAAFLVTEDVE